MTFRFRELRAPDRKGKYKKNPAYRRIYCEKKGAKVERIHIGGSRQLPFCRVKYVPAWHSSSVIDGGNIIYAGTPAGIILNAKDLTIYHAGDTGIFGDMLSYIRLFGLGTAGGILGLVVNSVAMNMSGIPYVGWFFTGLMLLVGHTAVLLLNSLGAFVHPMRLTFVEFYKNAGFGGGGRAFRPLTKNEN